MRRKLFTVAAVAAILGGIFAYAVHSTTPARAAANPTTSGPGAALCYWNDSIQPYAIDGGQETVQAVTPSSLDGNSAYYGLLEAQPSNGTAGQQFDLCYQWQKGYWYLQDVASGLFVSAEVEYPGVQNGLLRARSEEVGPWEQFMLGCQNGLLTIKSLANGKYVSTELAYKAPFTDELRARQSAVGPWELYRDSDQVCGASNPI